MLLRPTQKHPYIRATRREVLPRKPVPKGARKPMANVFFHRLSTDGAAARKGAKGRHRRFRRLWGSPGVKGGAIIHNLIHRTGGQRQQGRGRPYAATSPSADPQ